ncbi:MAG: hypothetical protein MUO40_06690 [Anaerolineaceae bacterium]|nr:hypothetical protein [Anaerolineaceae bacterium]
MDHQPANQIGMIGGKVLGNGASGRGPNHVNRRRKLLPDHHSIVVSHVLHRVTVR